MKARDENVVWYSMDNLPPGRIDPSRMGKKRSPTDKERRFRVTKADWEATRLGIEADRLAGRLGLDGDRDQSAPAPARKADQPRA